MKNLSLLIIAFAAATLTPLKAGAAAGYLYESDFSTGTIFQFTNPSASPVPSPTPTSTIPKKITFKTGITGVRGLAFDRSGNLFVGQDERILKITAGGALSIFASNLHGPNFLAVDRAENLFATDRDGNILKFTPLGAKSIFASGLNKPTGLAFDFFGNLFVADYATNAIFRFTPSGARSTFAQGLNGPQGLAFDRQGILYVANPGTKSIEAFTPVGSRFPRLININSPVAVAVDNSDNLFVADNCNGSGTNSIYRLAPGDSPVTVFASGLGCPLALVFEPARDPLLNISTRARVDIGPDHPNQELIGGFIIAGTEAKTVLIRAIGPSLGKLMAAGKQLVPDPLSDPILELHTPGGTITNDNWMDAQKTDIQSTGLAPPDDRESAILITLDPGSYTAIVRGHTEAPSGVASVEVYDLDLPANSTLANISSRGFVQTGDNVMIAGFIINGGNGAGKVLVRALGPSLADAGITNFLRDPTLDLRNANGTVIKSNDDWQNGDQVFDIYATGIPPASSREAAIVITLTSGQYTAIVQGLDEQGRAGGTGVGLIEVYNLR